MCSHLRLPCQGTGATDDQGKEWPELHNTEEKGAEAQETWQQGLLKPSSTAKAIVIISSVYSWLYVLGIYVLLGAFTFPSVLSLFFAGGNRLLLPLFPIPNNEVDFYCGRLSRGPCWGGLGRVQRLPCSSRRCQLAQRFGMVQLEPDRRGPPRRHGAPWQCVP